MRYCEKCRKVSSEYTTRCTHCNSKKLRGLMDGDLVFLAERDSVWSGALVELLDKNGIKYLKEGTLGEGINTYIGYGLESYSFYVPLAEYDKAKKLYDDIFTQVTDDDVFVDSPDGAEAEIENGEESDV